MSVTGEPEIDSERGGPECDRRDERRRRAVRVLLDQLRRRRGLITGLRGESATLRRQVADLQATLAALRRGLGEPSDPVRAKPVTEPDRATIDWPEEGRRLESTIRALREQILVMEEAVRAGERELVEREEDAARLRADLDWAETRLVEIEQERRAEGESRQRLRDARALADWGCRLVSQLTVRLMAAERAPAKLVSAGSRARGLLFVDAPLLTEAPVVAAPLTVGGWAASTGRVSAVKIRCDGRVVGTTGTGLSRPDVAAAYPDLRDAASAGFSWTWDLAGVAPGPHVLAVSVADDQGWATDVAGVIVVAPRGEARGPVRGPRRAAT